MSRIQIRFHPAIYVYLLSMAWLSSWENCVGAMFALAIHESGHVLAAYFVKEPIEKLELTPFGGIITYAEGKSPQKGIRGIIIAASGPAANYLSLIGISWLASRMKFSRVLIHAAASGNLTMLCLNLLPALPLDGGRIVFCIGYYFLPVLRLIGFLSASGVAVGAVMLTLSAYGCWTLGRLNCSLVIVGIYLIFAAVRSGLQMKAENLCAVLQECAEDRGVMKQVELYNVSGNLMLHNLAMRLQQKKYGIFLFEDHDEMCLLTQSMLCRAYLEDPGRSVSEVCVRMAENIKKS